jgi:hypothetical protein
MILENSVECKDMDEHSYQEDSLEEIKTEG